MDSAQSAPRGDAGTAFTSVPIEITVSVGRARPLVRELLQLNEGSVLTLDKQLDDPVELYVGEKLIGIGVLEVIEGDGGGQLAVRITEVLDLRSPA
jgi:flagellar motor switch protein FliN/FliY